VDREPAERDDSGGVEHGRRCVRLRVRIDLRGLQRLWEPSVFEEQSTVQASNIS